MPDNRHPDHAWQEHTFGCAHTSCGRVLPQYRTAAAFDDPSGWKNSLAVAPSPIATQGASAYHSLSGIPEPAPVDFSRPFRTPSSVSTVGRHYDALPTYQPEAVPHYAAMADEVNKQYDHMTNKLGINVQSMDHDPYPDVGSMMADVNNNHRLQVMGTHITGSHPFFDDATNDKFRAVHDFYGHAGTGRGFDRHGEEAAFIKHAGMFTPQARPALASETRGQNSSLILNGGFPGQKVATMDPRMMTAKGDPSYLKPGKCKYCKDQATKSILHSEGMAYVQTCDKHHAKGMKDAEACVPFGPPDPGNINKVYDLKTAMSWYTGGADTWPGKTTRERRDMWHNMGKWALEDADTHGFGHTPGDEYSVERTAAYYTEDDMRYGPPPGTRPIVRDPDGSTQELAEWARQGAAADWTHDPETDTYTHPSGHVLKPSDEMEGAHQLWTPTVGFGDRYPESLAKERGPSPDLQRHFDRVDFVTADPSPRKRMRRSMSRRIVTAAEQVQMLEPWLLEAAYGMEYDPADVPDHPRANQVYPELPMEHEPPEAPDERYIPEHLMKRRRSSFPQAAQGGLPRNAGVGDEVFEHLKHSPGGITFKHHPGDRGDVYEDDMGSRGYMVSTPDAEKKQDYATMTPKDVDDYYHGHPEIQEPGNSYGGWEEDREPPEPPGSDWYHDVPKNIHDTYDATGKALDWKQKAIFDNDKVDPKGNALDSAYLYTTDLANSGPASALGWTQAKRRMPT